MFHVLGETHERCHGVSGVKGGSGGNPHGLFASNSGRPPQWRLSDILGCSCGCSSSVISCSGGCSISVAAVAGILAVVAAVRRPYFFCTGGCSTS